MATLHFSATCCSGGAPPSVPLGDARIPPGELAHLVVMDTTSAVPIEQVLTLSELCAYLHVSARLHAARSRKPVEIRPGLRFRRPGDRTRRVVD